jgi:hypothetical protein
MAGGKSIISLYELSNNINQRINNRLLWSRMPGCLWFLQGRDNVFYHYDLQDHHFDLDLCVSLFQPYCDEKRPVWF